jgi:lactose/L-arabinose transport system substrate-binding protein
MGLRVSVKLMAACAVAALVSAPASAQELSGEITVWSWDIGASSLEAVVAGFNAKYPNVKVTVEDLGNGAVHDKALAGCAAGGEGLPDILSLQNFRVESYATRYPDCFANLTELGYDDAMKAGFAPFKLPELQVGDVAYAMPWDTGPVVMFYRRDYYENAGVDPATIKTWDDFIAAGKLVAAANPGVAMSMADLNGEGEWFNMLSTEQGCDYFAPDGQSITMAQPGCVAALEKLKEMKDAGALVAGSWGEKIQAAQAGTVASHLFGAWFEGTIRTSAPDQSGKWGVYEMPSLTADGPRAANLGGSALAIPNNSNNKAAAFAYLSYALGTSEGQVTMLKEFGLVPSLLSALDDPFVTSAQEYWGGQAIWSDVLATLPRIIPGRGTAFASDAASAYMSQQVRYLNGEVADATTALEAAAHETAAATGLPIAQ